MRLVESEVIFLCIHGNKAVRIIPFLRHDRMSQEGMVPSLCLKPYSAEAVSELTASAGLGTTFTPAQLSSVNEEEEEEEEEGEGVENVGAEDGIVMEGCYMAVAKSFTARRPDELDVKEGDVVCILDDAQAGDVGREIWW